MASWHDLSGHVALVTGGNSGIGKGMARGLHRAGASVAIWGTNAERNAATVAELQADGGAPMRRPSRPGRRPPWNGSARSTPVSPTPVWAGRRRRSTR